MTENGFQNEITFRTCEFHETNQGVVFPGLMSGMQKLASYIRGYNKLGGGNSNIFYFHPENWGRFPI